MDEKQRNRFTHKGDMVDDSESHPDNLTGDIRRKNPYKTPPNNLTTKSRNRWEEVNDDRGRRIVIDPERGPENKK
ncbi:hypothetical protein H0A61_00348 [Koleobacter methoxysyntrophicus]|jgi:hypothetical protein|uniref:Uncharacterized protein n=1 Tax=Koleobacter methoxysyntrophicus TaxID=2751313 RepID=A0A8A0RKH4_9FIRM|nr:hypothetical protein [Koleobacter methoxysyntrophicus]QSQ08029.1 hypothetical protein H0A61_00348 [Koleobacter methoxysyntrophicus]